MDWAPALHEVPGGTRLHVDVQPGASRREFPAGFDAWRQAIRMAVAEEAHDGAANRGVCRDIARFFGVPRTEVALLAGGKSRRKQILVPLPVERVLEALDG